MTIMDIIKKIGGRNQEFKEKMKNAEEEMKIQKRLEERSKSANERELQRYMEEERQRKIKSELDKIHKQQNKDMWNDNSILGSKTTILKDDRPILKEKNIFLDNKTKNPLTQRRMFFK